MRIQYISDIHLEFLSKLLKPARFHAAADILCLAGDIGYPRKPIYRQFIREMSTQFKKVFLIAGNHEYYGTTTMDQVHESIKAAVADLDNVTFLDNSYEDYEGVRFVGTTLWTQIPAAPSVLINDFHEIGEMTPELYNELHRGACEFLECTDVQESPLPIVVISHHLPAHELINPKYAKYAKYNQFFASDCSRFFKPPIRAWIYGHTHSESDKVIDGIRFVCNPVGYPQENERIADFNRVIELL